MALVRALDGRFVHRLSLRQLLGWRRAVSQEQIGEKLELRQRYAPGVEDLDTDRRLGSERGQRALREEVVVF